MLLSLLFSDPFSFAILAGCLVAALSIHEFAHAWVADRLGDPTPRSQGRVTLNPLSHLDPLGTLLILTVGLGWGRPVPFDPYNLRHVRRDTALIALAGPASNLLLSFALILILPLLPGPALIWRVLIDINVALAIFNLVPVAPLDGSKVLPALLPPTLAEEYEVTMHRYGLPILLLLLFPWAGGQAPVQALVAPLRNMVELGLFTLGSLSWGLWR